MEPHVGHDGKRRIARVHAADVRAERAAEAAVRGAAGGVEEVVHPLEVGAQLRLIRVRRGISGAPLGHRPMTFAASISALSRGPLLSRRN